MICCGKKTPDFTNVAEFASYYKKQTLKMWEKLPFENKEKLIELSNWNDVASFIILSKLTINDAKLFIQDQYVFDGNGNNNNNKIFTKNKHLLCINSDLYDLVKLAELISMNGNENDNGSHTKVFLWDNYFSLDNKIALFETEYNSTFNRASHLIRLLKIFQLRNDDNHDAWNFLKTCPTRIKNIINLSELQKYNTKYDISDISNIYDKWHQRETYTLAKYLYQTKIALVKTHIRSSSNHNHLRMAEIIGREFDTIKPYEGRYVIFAPLLYKLESAAQLVAWDSMPNKELSGPDFLYMLTCEGCYDQILSAIFKLFDHIKPTMTVLELLKCKETNKLLIEVFLRHQLEIAMNNTSNDYITGQFFKDNVLIPYFQIY